MWHRLILFSLTTLCTAAFAVAQPSPTSSRIDPEQFRAVLQDSIRRAQSNDAPGVVAELRPLVGAPGYESLPEPFQIAGYILMGSGYYDLRQLPEAWDAFKHATTFPQADGDAWRFRFLAASELHEWDDAVSSTDVLAHRFPSTLESITNDYVGEVSAMMRNAPNRDALLLRFFSALHDAHYHASDPLVDNSYRWTELTRLLLGNGQIERARQVAAEVTDPEELVAMMVDLRFDPVMPSASRSVSLVPLFETDLARKRAIVQTHPDLLEYLNDLIWSLERLDRNQEALSLADAALARASTGKAFDDQNDNLNWTHNDRSYALLALGRNEEAIREMAGGARQLEHGSANVSQLINLAEMQMRVGHNAEAVGTLATLDEHLVSGYGWMNAHYVLACAHHRAGEEEAAQRELMAMRVRSADSKTIMLGTELCFGNMDAAARLYIADLADPGERGTSLMMMQTFVTPRVQTDLDRNLQAAFDALRARPDVAAAFRQYGRILSLPIRRGNY